MTRPSPYMRLGWVAALWLLSLVPRVARSAEPVPSEVAASSPSLEVEVDPSIPEAESLTGWIYEEGTEALAALASSSDHRGTIHVAVAGNLYDYAVTLATTGADTSPKTSTTWTCECTNEDLLAHIRTSIDEAGRALESPAREPESSTGPRRWSPFEGLERRGRIGAGLIAAGSASTIVGIAFLTLGEHTRHGSTRNYNLPGVPTLLAGVGLIAAGTSLIMLERRASERRDALRLFPLLRPTQGGAVLGLTGGF